MRAINDIAPTKKPRPKSSLIFFCDNIFTFFHPIDSDTMESKKLMRNSKTFSFFAKPPTLFKGLKTALCLSVLFSRLNHIVIAILV
jgi:hypothetical protein